MAGAARSRAWATPGEASLNVGRRAEPAAPSSGASDSHWRGGMLPATEACPGSPSLVRSGAYGGGRSHVRRGKSWSPARIGPPWCRRNDGTGPVPPGFCKVPSCRWTDGSFLAYSKAPSTTAPGLVEAVGGEFLRESGHVRRILASQNGRYRLAQRFWAALPTTGR